MIDYPQGVEVDVPGIPEDTKYIADRLERIEAQLKEIADATTRREKLNPTILPMTRGRPSFVSSTRFRLTGLIVSDYNNGAVRYQLTIGTQKYTFATPQTLGTFYVPFPLVIDAGIDISVTVDSGQIGADSAIYLIGYADQS